MYSGSAALAERFRLFHGDGAAGGGDAAAVPVTGEYERVYAALAGAMSDGRRVPLAEWRECYAAQVRDAGRYRGRKIAASSVAGASLRLSG